MPSRDRQVEPQTSQAHVLVVDDNAINRKVAEALCGMFHCTSECVSGGLEAVEAARGGRFDLILMDINMPGMDGLAATLAIQNLDGPARLTPIVALTAAVDPAAIKAYRAAGMCAVVAKPVRPDQLFLAIQTALKTRRSGARRTAVA